MKIKLLLLLLFGGSLWAQNDCRIALENAQNSFYNGRFQETLELLHSCNQSNTDKALKLQVLELEARAQLMLGSESKSEELMTQILNLDPYYSANETRSANLKPIYDRFQLYSPWQFDAYAGPSFSNYRVLAWRSIAGDAMESYYSNGLAWQSGLGISRSIAWGFNVKVGLEYQYFSFSRSEIQNGYMIQSSEEQYHFAQFPLGLSYQYFYKNFGLELEASMVGMSLQNAMGDIRIDPLPSDEPQAFPGSPDELLNYDLNGQRREFGWAYRYGLAIKYYYRSLGFRIGVAQQIALYNQVQVENRYADPQLSGDLNYVSDDFAIDQLMLQFGLTYRILKPYKTKD